MAEYRKHEPSLTHEEVERTTFLCSKCDKKFLSENDLSAHIKFIHKFKKKLFICEECGKRYVSAAALNSHKIAHSEEKPFKCTQCSKSFKRLVTLKVHEESHENQNVICSICGKHINSRSLLNRHMVFHSEEKKYKCNFCGKKFRRSDAFKHHLILHSRLKPYECVFCDLTFADGSNCRKHQKVAHPTELAAAEAMGIVKVYKNVPKIEQLRAVNDDILLKPHKEISLTKDKQFSCDLCGKETTSSRSLEVHKLIHIQATHKCDICLRFFKNVEKLSLHKKSCNVQCLICNLKLKNNQSLKEHVLLHTDVKNFKCTLCGYATKHRRNLKAHMLTHTGLKPYHCSYCEASYADQSNCKKHIKQTHNAQLIHNDRGLKIYTKSVPNFKELQQMMENIKRNTERMTTTKDNANLCYTKVNNESIINVEKNFDNNEDVEDNEFEALNKMNFNFKICVRQIYADNKFQENTKETENFNEIVIHSDSFSNQNNSEDKNFLQIKKIKMNKMLVNGKEIKESGKKNGNIHSLTSNIKDAIAKCEICNKTFLSKGACASHLKTKHSLVSKPVACKFCGKHFKAMSAHEKHELIHIPPEKRETFLCTQCDKKFLWEKHLKIHNEIVHIGKKSFICEKCGKGYLTLNALNAHIIVHSNEKPYKCTICPKSFKRFPALQEHLRNAHTETKNFKCQLCEYACRDRRNLKTHMLIHAKLKPYHCPFCEASYSDLSNCTKHEKHAHPVEYIEMKSNNQRRVHSKSVPTFCELKEIMNQIKLQTS